MSVVEMGVAGGRGLLALERIAKLVAEEFDIQIHLTGFDGGQGMPPPADYRDVAHVWGQGFYGMDAAKLKAQLAPSTELVLGDVGETVANWAPKASIGFIAFDLDYHSSTRQAFGLFDKDAGTRLPRTFCYFDDIIGEYACHNEYLGELCAIREFNEEHQHQKICPIHLLRHVRALPEHWNEQIYVHHDFQHPLYSRNVNPTSEQYTQLPL